jgi:quercetin dioxygenase-like cupin family protein
MEEVMLIPRGRLIRRGLPALAAIAAALVPRAHCASAADRAVVTVTRAASPQIAAAENFTGQAMVTAPFRAPHLARASGAIVTFAGGARTAWHTHPLGQTLIVISGTGIVQSWGDPAQHIGPGDVAWIPPGAKHWHGAIPTGPMPHLVVGEALEGRTVEWLEQLRSMQKAGCY